MGKYFETVTGFQGDELLGSGGYPVELWNVACASSATLERGDLICAASPGGVYSVAGGASDAGKCLAICAAPNDGATVTTAYVAGAFNRDKITFGGASTVNLDDFTQALRTQNIHLTRRIAE